LASVTRRELFKGVFRDSVKALFDLYQSGSPDMVEGEVRAGQHSCEQAGFRIAKKARRASKIRGSKTEESVGSLPKDQSRKED